MSRDTKERWWLQSVFTVCMCVVLVLCTVPGARAQSIRESRPVNVEKADQLRQDLREMITSCLLPREEWERSLAELGQAGGALASLTIFGGFDECELPGEDEEVDSLAVQRHLGNISESAGQALQYGIGRGGAERTATVRRAILATA